jgi:hypothetical protein
MSWLGENANAIYVLLVVIAAALVVTWRFNQQVKYLVFAFGVLVLGAVLFILIQTVPSDRKQIEDNVHAMKDAILAGQRDRLFDYVDKDFRYKDMTREDLFGQGIAAARLYKVREVKISNFRVEDLKAKTATARFGVSAWAEGNDQPFMFVTKADFVRDDRRWKLKAMRFYKPLVDQDQEMDLPGIR